MKHPCPATRVDVRPATRVDVRPALIIATATTIHFTRQPSVLILHLRKCTPEFRSSKPSFTLHSWLASLGYQRPLGCCDFAREGKFYF